MLRSGVRLVLFVCENSLASSKQDQRGYSDQELYFELSLVFLLRALHTVDEGLEVQLFWTLDDALMNLLLNGISVLCQDRRS